MLWTVLVFVLVFGLCKKKRSGRKFFLIFFGCGKVSNQMKNIFYCGAGKLIFSKNFNLSILLVICGGKVIDRFSLNHSLSRSSEKILSSQSPPQHNNFLFTTIK